MVKGVLQILAAFAICYGIKWLIIFNEPAEISVKGGYYFVVFTIFAPIIFVLAIGLILLTCWSIDRLVNRFMAKPLTAAELLKQRRVLRVYDEDGVVRNEMNYSEADKCSGIGSGETGSMCGGCCGCIEAQLLFYGTPYKIEYVRVT